MFGLLGFIIAFTFANLFLIIATGVTVSAWRKKKKFPWASLIPLLVLQAISSYILLPRYYYQFENYRFMKTLTAKEVVNIQTDAASWTAPQDIEKIVGSLNQAVWHEESHHPQGPFVTMTITLQSGKIWKAHIGRYSGKDGAVFEFFRPTNNQGAYRIDGTAYAPGLAIILENLGYLLPFE